MDEETRAFLTEIRDLVAENNQILKEVQALAASLPQVMEQVTENPMFKPFAKMLGL